MMVMMAVASAAQAVQAHKTAQAQADYTGKSNQVAADAADEQSAQRQNDEARQMGQQFEQDAQQANQLQLDAMRQHATLDNLLGEYGAGGGSADRRLATLGVRQGQDLATLESNASKTQQEIGMGARADLSSIGNAKASSQRAVVRPTQASLGLNIASSALSIGSSYNRMNNPAPGAGT